jgi:flagellar basal body-associated protein FliL
VAEEQIVDETLDEGRDLGGGEKKPGMAPEKKKKIIIIALAATTLISVLGGGSAVAILMLKGTGDGGPRELDTSALREPGPDDLPMYHEFPELNLDIKSKGRRTRYIRIRMMAEVYFPENMERLQAVEPKILDGIQTYLRSKTAKELSGRAGTEAMRDAFNQIARRAMGKEHKINTILFKEILVQ